MTSRAMGISRGIARQLTGPGRSAIATIQVVGDLAAIGEPQPLFRAVKGKPPHEFAINLLHFGVWGNPGEDVVVCRTGNDTLEITCHGGIAAVSRVLDDLAGRGFSVEKDAARSRLPLSVLQGARTQRTAEIYMP